MQVVGLTGGIGTGKSTVTRQLLAEGIPVVDCDELARSALRKVCAKQAHAVRHVGTESCCAGLCPGRRQSTSVPAPSPTLPAPRTLHRTRSATMPPAGRLGRPYWPLPVRTAAAEEHDAGRQQRQAQHAERARTDPVPGHIDRDKLGALVFSDKRAKRRLEVGGERPQAKGHTPAGSSGDVLSVQAAGKARPATVELPPYSHGPGGYLCIRRRCMLS
jgi:hypothetical protein